MCRAIKPFVFAAVLLVTGLAQAGNKTWNGSIDSNWNNGSNWTGGLPGTGDDLIFPNSPSNKTLTNNITPGTVFNSITFQDSGGYTISGNAIGLSGGTSAIGMMVGGNSGANTISLNITFSASAPSVVMSGTASLTLSGTLANGGFDITFDSTAPITVSGVISGTGGIIDQGSGGMPALTLSGANTYTGATTVNNNGTVIVANNSALGGTATGTTVNAGGTLILNTGVTITGEDLSLDGVGQGGGALVSNTGTNTWNGNITIATNGTLIGGLTPASNLTLGSGGNLALGANGVSFVGQGSIGVFDVVTGGPTCSVTVAASGGPLMVAFSGTNTYQGQTSVASGELIVVSSVTPNVAGPLGNNNTALQLSGNGTLQVQGTFSRDITAASGAPFISITNTATLASAITMLTDLEIGNDMAATSCNVGGTINIGAGTNLGCAPGPAQQMFVSAAISGLGTLSADGPGILNISGVNSYSGPTTVNVGTLKIGAANAIPSGSDLSLGANSLDMTGGNLSLNSVGGAGMINLASHTLTIVNSGTTSLDAALSGSGGLTMSGSGTLTVTSPTSSYTGSTSISSGEMVVTGSIASSSVSVTGGATLAGTGTTGPVTSTGGAIAPGNTPAAFGILHTGSLTLDAASVTNLKIKATATAGTDYDELMVGGAGAFTSAGILSLDLTGLSSPGTATLAAYSSHPGSFANTNILLINNASNFGVNLNYGAAALTAQITLPIPAPTLNAASDSGTLGDNITNITTPTISGTGAVGLATITVFDAATMLGTTAADGAGNWSFTCPSPLSSGPHALNATQCQSGGFSMPLVLIIDTTPPSALIAQQTGQADPTSATPIKFLVAFTEPIVGFTSSDVVISGTAGATTAALVTVTPGLQFEVDVTGMTKSGTVIINIPASAVTDAAGNPSTAASVADNTVTFNAVTAPSIVSQLTACGDQFQPFTYTISATGTAPISYTATGLPAGLSLTGAVISGSPSVYGTFSVTLTASNAATPADSKTLSLTIVPQGISITSPTSAQGKVGAQFNYSFSGTSGAPPVSFTIGTPLPGGLTASGSTISGTPTTAGDFTVPVTATDAAGQTFTGSLAISILAKTGNSAPIVDPILTDIPTGDTGDVGTPVDFSVNAVDPEGGSLTYAWTITAGATPAVLANATASEYLQTFDVAGTYTVRVTVTDTTGASAFQETTISVTTPAPSAPTLATISINDPDNSAGGTPVVATSSTKFPTAGDTVVLTSKGATVVTGPLKYTWDFGDGSAISAPSTAVNITHVYATAGDYTVTLDAVDANNVHAAHKVTALVSVVAPPTPTDTVFVPLVGQSMGTGGTTDAIVPDPMSAFTNAGVVQVTLPLGTMITDAGPARFTLSIQVSTPTTSLQPRYRALTAAERDANDFTTDFGISGRGLVKGTEPSVHYQEPKLFVATTHMRDKATKVEVSKARITLPVSRADVGLPPVVTAEPKSRVIGVTGVAGAFNFSRNSSGQTLALTPATAADLGGRGDVSDKMTVTGSFEMPAGLDMSKPQEVQFALGNVVETIVLSPKGMGKSTRATLKVSTKSKTGMTTAGQMAKYSIQLNAPGLSAAGFESEGVTDKPMGKGVVVHGAMMIGGITYAVGIPTTYGVKAKGTSTTGALKLLKSKKK